MRGTMTAGVVLFLALVSPAAAQEGEAVFDGVLPEGRLTVALDSLIGAVSLGEGENFRAVEIGRDPHSSHHIVYIRDRETPHRHDRHDLFLVVLRGSGGMLQGQEERPVPEGSILFVPRGTVHAFRNGGSDPAVAYAIFSPAFDGHDRVDAAGPGR